MNPSENQGETVSRSKSAAIFALRGAMGFGAGSVVAFLLLLAPRTAPFGYFTGMIVGFPLSGAVGGLSLTWPIRGDRSPSAIALGYGIGFLIGGIVLSISLVAEEKPFMLYSLAIPFQAVGFAIGLGIAAAIGTAFISFRLALIAAITFAVGGLVGGSLQYPLAYMVRSFDTAPPASSNAYLAVILFEILISYALGGALLGAAMGYFCDFD